jgi:hypothetical protein
MASGAEPSEVPEALLGRLVAEAEARSLWQIEARVAQHVDERMAGVLGRLNHTEAVLEQTRLALRRAEARLGRCEANVTDVARLQASHGQSYSPFFVIRRWSIII